MQIYKFALLTSLAALAFSTGDSDARPARTTTAVVAQDMLKPLGLAKTAAYGFDATYGWVTGGQTSAILFESSKLTALDLTKSGAEVLGSDAAATFRVLDAASITPAFLKQAFPGIYGTPEARPVLQAILAAKRTGALFSPGKGRVLYVGSTVGTIYYLEESLMDAPSFTRLKPMAMPKLLSAKRNDAKAMDQFMKNLPPCTSGKFPCKE